MPVDLDPGSEDALPCSAHRAELNERPWERTARLRGSGMGLLDSRGLLNGEIIAEKWLTTSCHSVQTLQHGERDDDMEVDSL